MSKNRGTTRLAGLGGGPEFRPKLKLNLLENGIDFIRSGIERYFLRDEPSPRDHKYAVLHIFAGVLLLLKERLRLAHPSLVFSRVEEMQNANARTVDFDSVLNRLQVCADVKIPKIHQRTLREAQNIRNQLEHYEVALDLEQTQEIVGRLCEFVYVFMRDELATDLKKHLKRHEVWNRVQELRGIAEEIEKERFAEWKTRAAQYTGLTPEKLRQMYDGIEAFHPKHNPNPVELLECPICGQDRVLMTDERDIGVCTNPNCGQVAQIDRCLRCERPLISDKRYPFCSECFAYIDAQ